MELLFAVVILAYMAICAFAASHIAVRKNRGRDEWFVCGEIFGLIAVITVLLLPPLSPGA